MSRAIVLVLTAATVLVGSGAAALAPLRAGTLDVFQHPVELSPLTARVDVKPEAIELRSSGVPVTVFVELPPGQTVAAIVVTSVQLCASVAPCSAGAPATGKPKVGDANGDGVPDLKLAFARSAVIALIPTVTPPATVTLALAGLVGSGAWFTGTDTVRLVDP